MRKEIEQQSEACRYTHLNYAKLLASCPRHTSLSSVLNKRTRVSAAEVTHSDNFFHLSFFLFLFFFFRRNSSDENLPRTSREISSKFCDNGPEILLMNPTYTYGYLPENHSDVNQYTDISREIIFSVLSVECNKEFLK